MKNRLLKQYKNVSFKLFLANINNNVSQKQCELYQYKMIEIEQKLNDQGIIKREWPIWKNIHYT